MPEISWTNRPALGAQTFSPVPIGTEHQWALTQITEHKMNYVRAGFFVFAADVAAERSYYLQDSNKRVNMWPSARTVRPDLWAVTQLEAAAQTKLRDSEDL